MGQAAQSISHGRRKQKVDGDRTKAGRTNDAARVPRDASRVSRTFSSVYLEPRDEIGSMLTGTIVRQAGRSSTRRARRQAAVLAGRGSGAAVLALPVVLDSSYHLARMYSVASAGI